MTPRRIQKASRALNGLPAVKADRTTVWGNPFPVSERCDAVEAVSCFKFWLKESEPGRKLAAYARLALRGKNLACWCKPGTPCHCDVLLQVANE